MKGRAPPLNSTDYEISEDDVPVPGSVLEGSTEGLSTGGRTTEWLFKGWGTWDRAEIGVGCGRV